MEASSCEDLVLGWKSPTDIRLRFADLIWCRLNQLIFMQMSDERTSNGAFFFGGLCSLVAHHLIRVSPRLRQVIPHRYYLRQHW